jgi:hypothetical protein
MKSKLFATIENGKIISWTDSSSEEELKDYQIPLTIVQYEIVRAVHGDLKTADFAIRNIQQLIDEVDS